MDSVKDARRALEGYAERHGTGLWDLCRAQALSAAPLRPYSLAVPGTVFEAGATSDTCSNLFPVLSIENDQDKVVSPTRILGDVCTRHLEARFETLDEAHSAADRAQVLRGRPNGFTNSVPEGYTPSVWKGEVHDAVVILKDGRDVFLDMPDVDKEVYFKARDSSATYVVAVVPSGGDRRNCGFSCEPRLGSPVGVMKFGITDSGDDFDPHARFLTLAEAQHFSEDVVDEMLRSRTTGEVLIQEVVYTPEGRKQLVTKDNHIVSPLHITPMKAVLEAEASKGNGKAPRPGMSF